MSSGRLWVRLPNWLGDVLMARPMLHALRAGRAAAVRVAAPPGLAALLAGENLFESADDWTAGPAGRGATLRRVRDWRPDAAIVLPPSFRSALEAFQTGAPRRIGYRGEARDLLLTDALRRPARGERHLAGEFLALSDRLDSGAGSHGAPPDGPRLALGALPVDSEARAAARAIAERAGVAAARLALLAPGARYGPAKRWDPARYAELGRRLIARGFGVAVCGGAEERAECEALAHAIGAPAASLAGRTTLREVSGLCADAAVTVSNDSGFAHLSAAVGAPTIVLFGSTSSAWTAPLGARVRVVQHAPFCSPCFQRRCRIGTVCLTAIAVDEVERVCAESAA